MRGFTQSFNISVAVAMTLQYADNLGIIQPDLSSDEQDNTILQWLLTDIPHGKAILHRAGLCNDL